MPGKTGLPYLRNAPRDVKQETAIKHPSWFHLHKLFV